MIKTQFKTNDDEKWNQWFAGLTDGDGCFYINKKEKTISFEMTTHVIDARILYNIKNKLKGGTVKLRSHAQAMRYRVKQKNVILDIVHRLNGRLQLKSRFSQFEEVCRILDIPLFPSPVLLDKQDAYLSGFIDADGSFTISVTRSTAEDSQKDGVEGRSIRLTNSGSHNQISVKITSVSYEHLKFIQKSYGFGKIYIEKANVKNKSPKQKYHWTLKSYEDFQFLYDYLKRHPLKSVKMHRMRLSFIYFKYKQLGYHLKPVHTIEFKIWKKFSQSWFKYSY
uniref:LAGLIDADG homing endonuclease n=1 Tax=Hydrocytium acuminatum TaxID=1745963 RepID=UPI002A8010D3|nr:LAGLIDADG homing endonuclease [Hydrocytium acuminatum]WOR09535.1 LAGLIDADG homing endonuclease [Hydrocytium acuminatum]